MIQNPKTFFEQFQNFIEESGLQLKKFKSNLSNYFTKSEAIDTFLGKTDKAESAKKADEAIKATQDASGNIISSTYLTQANASSTYLTKTGKATSASTADTAGSANTAIKATQDALGNVITATYATKAELSNKLDTSSAFTKAQADKLYLGKSAKATSASVSDTATSATKATQDASGNIITSTYATKTEVTQGLAGKANTSHTHTSADVTDLNVTISNALKPYATTNEVTKGLAGKANSSHTHTKSQITDFPEIPDAILKNGNRGAIAGYEQWTKAGATTTLNVSSGDALLMETGGAAATITVQAGSIGQVATKLVWVNNSIGSTNNSITINGSVGWWGDLVPTLNKRVAVLLFFFHDRFAECRLIGQWD